MTFEQYMAQDSVPQGSTAWGLEDLKALWDVAQKGAVDAGCPYVVRGIPALMERAHQTAKQKGWWKFDDHGNVIASARNFGEMIALMHSELSECLEEWRKPNNGTFATYVINGKPEGIPIEFADLLIRVFDNCEAYGINLEAAILQKMEYNETRPYRHGNKLA